MGPPLPPMTLVRKTTTCDTCHGWGTHQLIIDRMIPDKPKNGEAAHICSHPTLRVHNPTAKPNPLVIHYIWLYIPWMPRILASMSTPSIETNLDGTAGRPRLVLLLHRCFELDPCERPVDGQKQLGRVATGSAHGSLGLTVFSTCSLVILFQTSFLDTE